MQSTQVILASRPDGAPAQANFQIQQAHVPDPRLGDVLLKTRYLSLDPYMRARMYDGANYAGTVPLGVGAFAPMLGDKIDILISIEGTVPEV